MSDRSPHTVRCDDELWSQFVEWIEDKEGQKHGEIGRHVEYALKEYIDADRAHRVEENQEEMQEQLDEVLALLSDSDSTHTHKNISAMTVPEKEKVIVRRLEPDGPVLSNNEVESVISEVGGADDRTMKKHKEELKRQGDLFEHPNEGNPVWFTKRELWIEAVENYVPNEQLDTYLDPYPMSYSEYADVAADGGLGSE